MAFDAVVFGTYVVGTGFTVGDSIPNGGFDVYIVPTSTIGLAPLDVTITYVDQFGNSQTADVSTSVEAETTSGTHVRVSLNLGDSGIRSISSVSVTGGTTGDEFTLESWNEGLGGALSLVSTAINQPSANTGMIGSDEWSPNVITENEAQNALMFSQGVSTSNVTYDGSKFVLETEEIEPSYESMDEDDGFLQVNTTVSNASSLVQMYLKEDTSYEAVD